MSKEAVVSVESVLIRDHQPDDMPFIYSTWLKGLYYGDSWFSLIPKAVFMAYYHHVLETLLSRQGTVVKVACLKSDPTTVLGYSVFHFTPPDSKCLDWVFVKRSWRTIGIAKRLVPLAQINTVTHLTKTGVSMLYDRPTLRFNPFVII